MYYLILNSMKEVQEICSEDPGFPCPVIENIDVVLTHPAGHNAFYWNDGELCLRSDFNYQKVVYPQVPTDLVNGATQETTFGYFGNVWFRKLYFPKKETVHDGHEHKHDHVSLLTKGSVVVEVEGCPSIEYRAPTAIIIRANKRHKIMALEDDTQWWCIFAMRDLDGEVIDHFDPSLDPMKDTT